MKNFDTANILSGVYSSTGIQLVKTGMTDRESSSNKNLYPKGAETTNALRVSNVIHQGIIALQHRDSELLEGVNIFDVAMPDIKGILVTAKAKTILANGKPGAATDASVFITSSTYNSISKAWTSANGEIFTTVEDFHHPIVQLAIAALVKRENEKEWNAAMQYTIDKDSEIATKVFADDFEYASETVFALQALVYYNFLKPFSPSQENATAIFGVAAKSLNISKKMDLKKFDAALKRKIKNEETSVIDLHHTMFVNPKGNVLGTAAKKLLSEGAIRVIEEDLEMEATGKRVQAPSFPTTTNDFLNKLSLLAINSHEAMLNRTAGYSQRLFDIWEENVVKSAKLVNETVSVETFRTALLLKSGGQTSFMEFVGQAGSGKTTSAFIIGYLLGLPTVLITGGARVEEANIFGQPVFDGDKVSYPDNDVVMLMREGGLLIVDEWTAIDPGALMKFNSIMDGSRQYVKADGREVVKIHKNFRIIFTSNPDNYAGTQEMNMAMQNRMMTSYIDMPNFRVIGTRLQNSTGYKYSAHTDKMAQILTQINELTRNQMEDSRTISPRNLENWISAAYITGEFLDSSVSTLLIPLMRNHTIELETLDTHGATFNRIKASSDYMKQVCRLIEDGLGKEKVRYERFSSELFG